MKTQASNVIKKFLNDNGFNDVDVTTFKIYRCEKLNYIDTKKYKCGHNIHHIRIVSIDTYNSDITYSLIHLRDTHFIICEVNHRIPTRLYFKSYEQTAAFIRFIQCRYGFDFKHYEIIGSDIHEAVEANDVEWFKLLCEQGSDSLVRGVLFTFTKTDYAKPSPEIMAIVLAEMRKRGLMKDEVIGL